MAYIVNSSTSSRSEASEYIFDPVIAVILDPIMFKSIVHTVIVVILGSIMFKMTGSNIYSDASDLLEVDELTM
jgi:hypothetical protein